MKAVRIFGMPILKTMACVALAQLFFLTTVFADTCRESGGNLTCSGRSPVIGEWSYNVNSCASQPNSMSPFDKAVCTTHGSET